MPSKFPPPAKYLLLLVTAVFALSVSALLPAQERPWSVSPCALLKNPGMYTETLVSVPGLVLYGAQQFTSHGYDCADDYGVLRVEFGGNPTDYKDRFRLPQAQLEASAVPLKKDADYDSMQRLMKSADASGQVKMLRTTLIGRFFPGPAMGTKSGEIKYPKARLVISEVELVTDRLEDPVDFTPPSSTVTKPPKGCATTEFPVLSREEDDKLQRLSREPSEDLGYLADPKEVAARPIGAQENIPFDQAEAALRVVSEGIAIKDYVWTSSDGARTYNITVNRPYWLLPSTYSADTMIWVPKRIVRSVCANKAAR